MRVRLTLCTLLAATALSLTPRPVQAASDWSIQRFDDAIAIASDGSVDVTETIAVTFDQPHHGIFRDIPIRAAVDGGKARVYALDQISVADEAGTAYTFSESQQGDNSHLQIGDANATLTGAHTYVIHYVMRDLLNGFSDHDELYWNVNGPNWEVSADAVSATVTLPSGVISKTSCYQGPTGSQEPCTDSSQGATAHFAATRALDSGEQLTVVVGFPKGIVPNPTPVYATGLGLLLGADEVSPSRWLLALLIAVGGCGLALWDWIRHGRDRAYLSAYYLRGETAEGPAKLWDRDPIVVEFTPPQGVKPAQAGLLLDQSADSKDVTATIIDLAVRGYLTITELPKTGVLGHTDWDLKRTDKADSDLLDYEKTILSGIFNGTSTRLVSALKGTFHTELQRAESQINDDAVDQKWFASDPAAAKTVRRVAAGGLLVLAFLGGSGFVLARIALLLVAIVVFILSFFAAKRTALGSSLLRRVLGFRLYVNTAERDRQAFNEKQNLFADYLPWAVVFGCVSKWANAFGGLDAQPYVGSWYLGAASYDFLAISSSLNGLSTSVAGAVGAAAGGSGFGGGFSGGGGGGGGGGAW